MWLCVDDNVLWSKSVAVRPVIVCCEFLIPHGNSAGQALHDDPAVQQKELSSSAREEEHVGLHILPAHLGHLRCLLNMGHLQGMLAEVDGWAQQAAGAMIS